MKNYATIFLLLMGAVCSGIAQPSLSIINPIWGPWEQDPGLITEVKILVEPQGIFFQVDLFLEFSIMHPEFFNDRDSLEVEYFFDLPPEAIVTDSWLWIDNYISYGILMDVDSAARIYEAIVRRRTDPSILYDRGLGRHELRIYPITSSLPRRVKISYLLPGGINPDRMYAALGLHNFQPYLSDDFPFVQVQIPQDSSLGLPEIEEPLPYVFSAVNDPVTGPVYSVDIGRNTLFAVNTLSFPSPLDNGFFAGFQPTGINEGFYQVGVLPQAVVPDSAPRKVLILVDNQAPNSAPVYLTSGVIQDLARTYLSEKDSFNLMYLNTGLQPWKASDSWIPASDSLITSLLQVHTSGLLQQIISSQGSLKPLMNAAHAWLDNSGYEGEILLFSSCNKFTEVVQADAVFAQIEQNHPFTYPVHIGNYHTLNITFKWEWNGNDWAKTVQNNDYLFRKIAARSGGTYHPIKEYGYSMYTMFSEMFSVVGGRLDVTNIQVAPQMGFAHSSVSLDAGLWKNAPFRQIGKYYGNLPVSVEYFQVHDQTFNSTLFEPGITDLYMGSDDLNQFWAGNYLFSLAGVYSRQQLVDFSIDHRVLCESTAFLCLEDSVQRGLQTASQVVISIVEEELAPAGEKILIAPNPAQDHFEISLPARLADAADATLDLYGIHGGWLQTLDLSLFQPNGDHKTWVWDAFPFASGTYLLVLRSGQGVEMVRFTHIE